MAAAPDNWLQGARGVGLGSYGAHLACPETGSVGD
jgi:hypothetical protein